VMSEAVFPALENAGWIFADLQAICITNEIVLLIEEYGSGRDAERRDRVTPLEFRKKITKLAREIGNLIRQLPDESASGLEAMLPRLADDIGKLISRFPQEAFSEELSRERKVDKAAWHEIELGRYVINELNIELEKLEFEDLDAAPDFQFVRDCLQDLHHAAACCDRDGVAHDLPMIRRRLLCLRNAAERIRVDESGAGPPADRTASTLVRGLACIFHERTGKRPSAYSDGRFARFVWAVNELIPEDFGLPVRLARWRATRRRSRCVHG
jgi:hypothetical protein